VIQYKLKKKKIMWYKTFRASNFYWKRKRKRRGI